MTNRSSEEFEVKELLPCVICGKKIPFVSYWRPCCCEKHFNRYWGYDKLDQRKEKEE